MQANRVRKDALIVGTAWTLFLAAPHFLFKSSWTWPISVLSLAAAGLGWAAISAYALSGARRAPERGAVADSKDSSAAVDAVALAVIGEMQRACTELQRVDELLGHAAEQLLAAFSGLSEPLSAQRSDLDAAVTALQFRDVAGQKLGHVRAELAALEQALQEIRAACAQCAQEDLRARVGSLLLQLRQGRTASPARQELMQAGEVELF